MFLCNKCISLVLCERSASDTQDLPLSTFIFEFRVTVRK